MKYKPVIGLEIHVELSTKTKMFCGCSAKHFAITPNTNVCPVCLGLPGALPYANRKAVEYTSKIGTIFNCKYNNRFKFDRKHYFYPDLPKGYQISQYDLPIFKEGVFEVGKDKIGIRRVHLEEDTAKLVHQEVEGKKVSLVDFNRSGVPLVEIVTEPDFSNSDTVVSFLKMVQLSIKYLEVSDCDMEKGSMRLEANVSISSSVNVKYKLPDYKVELKNINSFKYLKKAIDVEIERQTKLIQNSKKVRQETRGFDEERSTTFSQRTKEGEQDYRYFPEPDLPPLVFDNNYFNSIKKSIDFLPKVLIKKYKSYGLKEAYVDFIVSDPNLAKYFEEAKEIGAKHNVSINEIASVIVNQKMHKDYPQPSGLVKKLVSLQKKSFSSKNDVEKAIEKVLNENQKAQTDFKSGKTEVIGFLIGMVQKELKGSGDPGMIRNLLRERLIKG